MVRSSQAGPTGRLGRLRCRVLATAFAAVSLATAAVSCNEHPTRPPAMEPVDVGEGDGSGSSPSIGTMLPDAPSGFSGALGVIEQKLYHPPILVGRLGTTGVGVKYEVSVTGFLEAQWEQHPSDVNISGTLSCKRNAHRYSGAAAWDLGRSLAGQSCRGSSRRGAEEPGGPAPAIVLHGCRQSCLADLGRRLRLEHAVRSGLHYRIRCGQKARCSTGYIPVG